MGYTVFECSVFHHLFPSDLQPPWLSTLKSNPMGNIIARTPMECFSLGYALS